MEQNISYVGKQDEAPSFPLNSQLLRFLMAKAPRKSLQPFERFLKEKNRFLTASFLPEWIAIEDPHQVVPVLPPGEPPVFRLSLSSRNIVLAHRPILALQFFQLNPTCLLQPTLTVAAAPMIIITTILIRPKKPVSTYQQLILLVHMQCPLVFLN